MEQSSWDTVQATLLSGTTIASEDGVINTPEDIHITQNSGTWSMTKFEFWLPDEHLIFNKPVKIEIDTPDLEENSLVNLQVLHYGDISYSSDSLTLNSDADCREDGTVFRPATSTKVENWKVMFYTCAASTFTVTPYTSCGTATAWQISQALVGSGVIINSSSITAANSCQVWLFNTDMTNVYGATSWVVFSSGIASQSVWPNNSTGKSTSFGWAWDASFDAITGGAGYSKDAATLSMNFTPIHNVAMFEYVFGSEEYNEFVWQWFEDPMGFIINGQNCALAPDSRAITIDTINNSNNASVYNSNSSPQAITYNTQMDGFTDVLRCTMTVNAGNPQNIKLWVADWYDDQLDSYLFVKGASFSSPAADLW
jgi:hypothetical protein